MKLRQNLRGNCGQNLRGNLGQKIGKIALKFSIRAGLAVGGLALGGLLTQTHAQNFLKSQQYVSGIDVAGSTALDGAGDPRLITVIQEFINRVLGTLGLIALIFLLYGGFMIVTAGDKDDAYKK